jgi:hypothetical protein
MEWARLSEATWCQPVAFVIRSGGQIKMKVMLEHTAFLAVIGASLCGGAAYIVWTDHFRVDSESLVHFTPAVVDLGSLSQGVNVSRTVRLCNNSDDAIRVVAVRTTCGCTAVAEDVLGAIIRADEDLSVPIRFASGNSDGEASSRIIITFDHRDRQYSAAAEVRALITPEYRVVPRALAFGEVREGEQKELIIRLAPIHDKLVTITDAVCPDPNFQVAPMHAETGAQPAAVVRFTPVNNNSPRDVRTVR